MNRSHSHINAPIIGKSMMLNNMILKSTKQTPNDIKHPYVDKLKTSGLSLVIYAIKMLKSDAKSYTSKVRDSLDEIITLVCMILSFNGITEKQAVALDVCVSEIEEQFNSIVYGQNTKPNGQE